MPCGSAISSNCGPIIVATKDYRLEDIPQLTLALPGRMTTAATFLSLLAPKPKSLIHTVYSQIETMVLQGNVDAGVLIHENRFTYQHRGLKLVADLGDIWNKTYAQCVPLGGVLVKKSLSYQVKSTILHTLQNSMMYARNHLEEIYPFIIKHAQDKSDEISKQHIDLYVNKETYSLSNQGLQSIKSLLRALHPAKSICEDMLFSL